MAPIEPVSLDLVAPGLPQAHRSAVLGVPRFERSLRTPEHQQWTGDPTPRGDVGPIVLAVERGGGAILLADGVGVFGMPQRLDIGGADFRREDPSGRAPAPQRIVHHGVGRRREDPLGKRLRLREQRPRPVVQRESVIRARPRAFRRHDVEHGRLVEPVGMVEGQTIGHPPPAIVARHGEAREAEPLHDDHHVSGLGPFGVRGVVWRRMGATALPIPPEIGADHGEVAREPRRHIAPHEVGLGKAMQQQQGRPGSERPHEDVDLSRGNHHLESQPPGNRRHSSQCRPSGGRRR